MISTTVGLPPAHESGASGPESAPRPRASRSGVQPEGRPAPAGLWNVGETAAYLQMSRHAIYKMTARQAHVRIPHIRVGGKLRFRQADIDRWLALLTVSNLEALERARNQAVRRGRGDA